MLNDGLNKIMKIIIKNKNLINKCSDVFAEVRDILYEIDNRYTSSYIKQEFEIYSPEDKPTYLPDFAAGGYSYQWPAENGENEQPMLHLLASFLHKIDIGFNDATDPLDEEKLENAMIKRNFPVCISEPADIWLFAEEHLLPYLENCKQETKSKFDYYDEEYRKLRLQVFLRDGEICAFCGAKPKPGFSLTIDHIKPTSKFPELTKDITNLQVLCWDCNQEKSDKIIPVKKRSNKHSSKKTISSETNTDDQQKAGYFFDELLKQL